MTDISNGKKSDSLSTRGRRTGLLMSMPLCIFTFLFVVVPFIYMIVLSFLLRDGIWEVKAVFSLKNYKDILEPVYMDTIWTSLKLAFISTVIMVLIGYPFGYFMARLSSGWKKIMMMLLMLPFWTSALIRMYGWIIILRNDGILDKFLMKLKIIDEPLRMLYSYPAVVVGLVYGLLPFMIFSVYSSAEKMDWGLVEAARDLGASSWGAFKDITFKMTLPGLLSGIVLTFIPSVGLFFIADVLGGNKVVLIGNLIQDQMLKVHNLPFAAALSVILSIVTGIILFITQKISKTKELEGVL